MEPETNRATHVPCDEMPVVALDLPVMYEDEGQDEMGETDPHYEAIAILRYGLKDHLADQPRYRVFSDLNVYYHPLDPNAYVSPDNMVIVPAHDLGDNVSSYRLNVDGPPPVLVAEVLSRRSFQQQDMTNKPQIYSQMGVGEYVLVDVSGEFLPQRLSIKRLQRDGSWLDEQDPDGGVTSQLGFRLAIESDGQLRVVDANTARRYARPSEAEAERRKAEDQIRALRAELEQLRKQVSSAENE